MREPTAASLIVAGGEAMRALGGRLARALVATPSTAPLVIALDGELGAGKTTLVGGLLQGLGFDGPVRSPTYTLIEPYSLAGRSIYHLDLYRLADPRELETLGIRDLLHRDAVLLVEWAERGGSMLPPPDLAIRIRYLPEDAGTRRLDVFGATRTGAALAVSLDTSAK